MTFGTWQKAFCLDKIPQRYVLGFMGFTGIANAYIMRACLSIAIVRMVKPVVHDETLAASGQSICPYQEEIHHQNTTIGSKDGYDWDESTQAMILSAFYYGYIVTHIPGGLLAQRYGGKHTMGLGIFSTALFTLLTPWVAPMGAVPLMILRLLMGLGEGTTFPALSTLLAQWAPPLERSKLGSLVFAGVQIGTVLASAVSGFILAYLPWPAVFYIWGGVGMVWFILWCLLCYNDPASHPFITQKEKDYLSKTIGATKRDKDVGGTPWLAILKSPAVWSLTIAEVGHDWALYTMVTDLPKYMNDVMHFNISQNGVLSALPYLVMWLVSILLGYAADKIQQKELVGITNLRKILATIGAVGPAVGVVLASYAGCDKTLVAVLFTVGMGFMGFCYSSLRVNALDLSPNFAGTIMAIVNGLGSISGMVAPLLLGALTPNKTLLEWRVVFWVMFGILNGTNVLYIMFGSGEIQPWNEPKEKEETRLDEM